MHSSLNTESLFSNAVSTQECNTTKETKRKKKTQIQTNEKKYNTTKDNSKFNIVKNVWAKPNQTKKNPPPYIRQSKPNPLNTFIYKIEIQNGL
eukprot:Pgem_evm1s17804